MENILRYRSLRNAFSLFIYPVLLFLGLVALQSCKKDLGNYEYHEVDMPQLDEAGLSDAYNVEQYGELDISPNIKFSGDASQLSYQWLSYIKSLSSPTIGPPTVLSTEKNLHTTIDIRPGNYYLELIVTDNKTASKTNFRVLLNVLAPIESGWMVLHSRNNESEVDFIVTDNILPGATNKRLSNMFETLAGTKAKGEGRFISQTRRANSDFNYITVGTSEEIKRLHGFTFSLLGTNEELFRRPPAVIDPQAHLNNDNEYLINNGLLYPLQLSVIQDAFFSGSFRGDYQLAPYMTANNYSSYGAVVYDQKNEKFLYTTSAISELNFAEFKVPADENQTFNMNAIGKQLLYMERGFNAYTYAFFKDDTGPGRYLYVVNTAKADDGKLDMGNYDLSSLPEIQQARFFDVGSLGNVALYATEKTIYSLDYSGSQKALLQYNSFAADEVITSMKIFKAKLNAGNTMTDFASTDNSLLFVATWDGQQGRVYEFKMNVASGILNPVPAHVYENFGKVMDMNFKFRGIGT